MSGDFQIGEWSVQPAVNRLRRGDQVVRLEPKVMHVLVCLAEHSGEVVSREELIGRVWADVFVTDDVLHRAIRELRRVFGDSPAAPTYIETIRKRGYRLLRETSAPLPATRGQSANPGTVDAAVNRPLPLPHTRWSGWQVPALALALTLLVATAVLILVSRPDELSPQAHARFVPIVSGPLNESDPAMSPDGRRIAFVQRAAGDDSSADIYIRDLGDGRVTRLTTNAASDRLPAWSPDGLQLAFVRISDATCDIVVRALGGDGERRVAPCGNAQDPKVTWTQDGRALLMSQSDGPNAMSGWRLARIDLASAAATELTRPGPGIVGDHSPAVSPDGASMAFIRRASGGVSDIYLASIDGTGARRLTFDDADLTGLDWASDGRSIVYSSDRAGGYSLWRVAREGGAPSLLAGGAARMKHPVADRSGRRIVYENWNYDINVWQVRQAGESDVTAPITRSSELWNLYPQVSPDGGRIAYVSTQSGAHELWIADRDGSRARQLTHSSGGVKSPRWSPDGRRIVYLTRRDSAVDVHYVDAVSGSVTAVTADAINEVAPVWSHDGERILFGAADPAGRWNVWSIATRGGAAPRLELANAAAAQPAPDGSALYYTRADRPGLWRATSGHPDARPIVETIEAGNALGWVVTRDGIYFVAEQDDHVRLRRAPLEGGAFIDIAVLTQFTWPGFSIAPDGAVLYARWDRRESNLMSVEF